jgi:hypothetical protein
MSYPVVAYSLFLIIAIPYLYNLGKKKLFFEGLILLWVFSYGARDHFNLPTTTFNMSFEAINFSFFIITILKTDNYKLKFPSIKLFSLFIITNLFSIISNDSDIQDSINSFRYIASPFLFFITLVNKKYNVQQLKQLINFVVFLFSFQILASILKIILIGFMEGIVGTVNVNGATSATLIPLIGISFAMSFFIIYKRQLIYLLFSAGMLFIGLASMKRGVFMYLIFLAPMFFYILNKFSGNKLLLKKLTIKNKLLLVMVFLSLFILGVKYNPLSNAEGKIGGAFDLNYVYQSTIDYSFNVNEEYSFGRMANFTRILDLSTQWDIVKVCFGFGPSTLQGSKRGDGAWEQFGIQGPTTGITYQIVQYGYFGAIICFLLFTSYLETVSKNIKKVNDPYWKAVGIGSIMCFIIYCFDYFTYSIAFTNSYAINYTYVTSVAIFYNYVKILHKENAKIRQTVS